MFSCPRRLLPREADDWDSDNTCTYCGSLNPAEFMARLQAQDVKLSPTDKNYKVYVENDGGPMFLHSYKKNGTIVHESRDIAEFYFYHLNEIERNEFISMYNAKKVKMVEGFYVLPYFCSQAGV